MSLKSPRKGFSGPAQCCQKIEFLPIDALQPHRSNARIHSKKQVRALARSIERFGFTNPILIDDANTIIAGHGRVSAARLLGFTNVPTLRIGHLNEAEKHAYVLADNRLAEKAGWDREILAIELQNLVELGFEIELTGFDTSEIDIILDEAKNAHGPDNPEDILPSRQPGTTVSKRGDLWILGNHRILCGDARDSDAYTRLLNGEKAEFVITDPPYNIPIGGHVSGRGKIKHKEFAMGCGEMSPRDFTDFLQTVFRQFAHHSIDGSIHDIFMDWRHMAEMLAAGGPVYGELKNLCIWNKSNAGMGTFYRSKHELVFIWKNGTAPHINNFELGQHGRSRTNVWTYEGANTANAERRVELAYHPTVKPVALIADAIKDCSRRGGIVLDAFAGSGTILIACERTGRKARAVEIDPHYVDVAIRRWEAFSGRKAILAGTDVAFDDPPNRRISNEAAVRSYDDERQTQSGSIKREKRGKKRRSEI